MPLPPRAALMQFLGRVFTVDDLPPWVFRHLHGLRDRLSTHVPIDALAMAVVDLAGNRGVPRRGGRSTIGLSFETCSANGPETNVSAHAE